MKKLVTNTFLININLAFFFGIILVTGCNNNPKTFIYKDNVEITLSPKLYLESSIIYNNKNEKVGELAGFFTPLKSISFLEYLEMYKKGEGEIQTQEGITLTFYGMYEELPDIIRIDSVQLTNYKWYFFIEKTIYESDDGNWGYWNAYRFMTFENDKILFITFYDKEIENDKSDYFINIIETVKIKY